MVDKKYCDRKEMKSVKGWKSTFKKYKELYVENEMVHLAVEKLDVVKRIYKLLNNWVVLE